MCNNSNNNDLNNSLEALRNYFRTAPKEELEADWAKVEAMGLEGPTLSEILALGNVTTDPDKS